MSARADDVVVAVDLTDDERDFMYWALSHWGSGLATYKALPMSVLGIAGSDEFASLTDRLGQAVRRGDPLSGLDWARALFLTELSFGSDLAGAGVEFSYVSHSDEDGIKLLRSIQRKLSSRDRAEVLFSGLVRPGAAG
jgi:hypothetical protein